MKRLTSKAGFTLVEFMIASGIFSVVSAGLMSFSWLATQMIAKNLGVNQGHTSARYSNMRLWQEAHDSYSDFTLITFGANATYVDSLAAATSADLDLICGYNLSNRANGFRFYTLSGGPCQLKSNTTSTTTDLTFALTGVSSDPPAYVPRIGDKIRIPLVGVELDIANVLSSPTAGNSQFQVRTAQSIGYTFANTSTATTTGYFYRKVGFSVFNNQLRFHKYLPTSSGPVSTDDIVVVADSVTSPSPFSFVCSNGGQPAITHLHVSLETYDTQYSGRLYNGSALTLQTTVSPHIVPGSALYIQND